MTRAELIRGIKIKVKGAKNSAIFLKATIRQEVFCSFGGYEWRRRKFCYARFSFLITLETLLSSKAFTSFSNSLFSSVSAYRKVLWCDVKSKRCISGQSVIETSKQGLASPNS